MRVLGQIVRVDLFHCPLDCRRLDPTI
jgi:hypothetical protein